MQSHIMSFDMDKNDLVVPPPILSSNTQQERNLRLSYALQSTLNVGTIIKLFCQNVSEDVPCSGILYTYDDQNIVVNVGKPGQHAHTYSLAIGNEKLGDIRFSRRARFSESDILHLEEMLCLLVYPLRNALHYHEALQTALYDTLTGAGNRASFEESFHREFKLSARHKNQLSLLALDLDYFKSINDEFGHAAGDHLLQQVAQEIGDCVRDSDLFFRVGGEEFIVLLRNTTAEGALLLANRIRENIEQMHCQYRDHDLKITVSIGVSYKEEGDTQDSFLEHADEALYCAKRDGRNCVRYISQT